MDGLEIKVFGLRHSQKNCGHISNVAQNIQRDHRLPWCYVSRVDGGNSGLTAAQR